MTSAELQIIIRARDQASAALSKVATAARSTSDKLKATSASLMQVGKTAGIAAGVGVGAITLLVKSAVEFDKAMREVNTLVGLSEDQMGSMREEVKALSIEMGIDAVEASRALYQAISAGQEPTEALNFLRVAAKAAVGGVTDLETAVDGLTSIMNAWGMQSDQATRVADVMFTVVKGGKTTMDELSSSIFQIAPIAAVTGVSLEEVGAAAATLTKQGIPTKIAMTGLRMAVVSLQKPTAEMTSLLQVLGYESGTAAIDALGLQGTFQALATETGATQEQLVKAVGSVESLQAVFGITGLQAEEFARQFDAVKNATGASQAAFEEMAKGASFQMAQARQTIEAVRREMGEALMPTVVAVAKGFSDILKPVIEWIQRNPQLARTIGMVAIAIVGLTGALAALAVTAAIATGALGAVAGAIAVTTGAVAALTAAFTGLNVVTGGIVIAIGAVIAILGLLIKEVPAVRNALKSLWSEIAGGSEAMEDLAQAGEKAQADIAAAQHYWYEKRLAARKELFAEYEIIRHAELIAEKASAEAAVASYKDQQERIADAQHFWYEKRLAARKELFADIVQVAEQEAKAVMDIGELSASIGRLTYEEISAYRVRKERESREEATRIAQEATAAAAASELHSLELVARGEVDILARRVVTGQEFAAYRKRQLEQEELAVLRLKKAAEGLAAEERARMMALIGARQITVARAPTSRALAWAALAAGEGPLRGIAGPIAGLPEAWMEPGGPPMLPGLPAFQQGGVVPGPLGQPRVVIAHGGEPIGRAGAGPTYVFHFPQFVGNRRELEDVVIEAIAQAERKGRVAPGITR